MMAIFVVVITTCLLFQLSISALASDRSDTKAVEASIDGTEMSTPELPVTLVEQIEGLSPFRWQ